ncbi:MAG: hypothetical protein K940chlam3_00635 [Chlamydiae bacterium]|nr:hypothetical protein [Chlamydiota bacterium]
MEPTINQSIDRINRDIEEIASITDSSPDKIQSLVSDIKIHFENINHCNFRELNESSFSEYSAKLEDVTQKVENILGEGIISDVEENELKEAIGQARLHARGISLENLPEEIILTIINNLDYEQIKTLFIGLQSRLSDIAQDEFLLSTKLPLDQRTQRVMNKFIEHGLSEEVLNERDKEILNTVEKLDLSNVHLSPGVLTKFVKLCPRIQHLKILSGVTDDTFQEIPATITSLDISGWQEMTPYHAHEKLSHLTNLTQVNTDRCTMNTQIQFARQVALNDVNNIRNKLSSGGAMTVDNMIAMQMAMNRFSQLSERSISFFEI